MPKNELYLMKLHERMTINENVYGHMYATRVPGGWIYTTTHNRPSGGCSITSTFVAFNSEFENLEL